MAKVSAEAGATNYVPEGSPVPDDLPPEVRLVGPGVPAAAVPVTELLTDGGWADISAHREPAAAPESGAEPGRAAAADAEPDAVDYAAYPIRQLRELVRERGLPVAGSKAELVARLEDADRAAA